MSLPYPTRPGDVDRLVAADHAVAERQFQHLESGRGERQVLAHQIIFALALHVGAEEKVLYPALVRGHRAEVDRARQGHLEMKRLLMILDRTDPGMTEFEHALARLVEEARTHAALLETELLPAFRGAAGPQELARLGPRYVAAKRTTPSRAHPAGPLSGPGHRFADAGVAMVDRVRDRVQRRPARLGTDASGLLDPQAQAVVDAHSSLRPVPYEILTPGEARRQPGPDDAVRVVMADRGLQGPEPVGSVRERQVPDGAGGRQTLRVYTPAGAGPGTPEARPVIVWVHGGGWVLFDVDTYDASCRGLANKTGAIVVTPDYRRAPEAVFPAAYDDVLAAYRWTVHHAAELGGDARRIGIGGESVGATMAVATSLQLAQAGEALPLAQVCVYPLATPAEYGESMTDAADARPLNRALLSWMLLHAFTGAPEAIDDPRVDLLGLPPERLAVLPPTLVVTAERDVLRSQGEELARRLAAAGVPTAATQYDGVMHEFFGAAAVLDKAEQAQRQASAHFTAAFA